MKLPVILQIQSPTTVTVSSYCHIGEIISLDSLGKLSSQEKCSILKKHFKPKKTYVFPKVHLYRSQRSRKIGCLRSSFVYSKKEDAIYSISCALFSPTDKVITLVSFVNTGYKGWNAIHDKQTLHNKYHDDATKEASGIITKFEGPNNIIPYQTSGTLRENKKRQLKHQLELSTLLESKPMRTEEQKKKPMIMTPQEILEIFQRFFWRLLIFILYFMIISVHHFLHESSQLK